MDDFSGAERAYISHLHAIADDLRLTAELTCCSYLTAHLPLAAGELLMFTYEHGQITVTGRGFEELLPEEP